ncbi:PTS fructose transporter subunit IIC [Nitriliruptor alkaliphilus]|uniref:PTS fructose transporter subunit IIC n=1 Tax=Nitriliruptor alkaliphilus TaxID=427918 RepID=UPI000697D259|nr:fructose-specific PTS transporter subunit EIIC [Nitriliruptor alkaliphilus]
MKLVAVTSCPTGIAHSEMAAEALEVAARERGHEMHVEVQGAAGDPPLAASIIAEAQAVVFAVDAAVRDQDRFAGLPKVQVRTREAIDKAGEIIDRAVAIARDPAAAGADGSATTDDADVFASVTGSGGGRAEEARRWLMTGVSYMIPFVVAGGILIAISFAIADAVAITAPDMQIFVAGEGVQTPGDLGVGAVTWFAVALLAVGGTAFSMLVPILAGFIAYAMADRPGIAPGVVGGLIANQIEAGFLGGLIAGLLAGGIVMALKAIPTSGVVKRMMPILVYPIVGTVVVGLLMFLVIGEPVAAINAGLSSWLTGLSGANQIVLGLILGLMMAFDMGGPVNKVAYTFGIAALDAGNFQIMAAVMAAGMTPPLGLALATVIRRKLFTPAEQQAGQAAWVMGASFITEGAIPFAAADPLRVIPSLMAGSAVTGALSLAFGATLRAPHGGIWVIGVIGNGLLYLLAILVGTAVTAGLVIALKSARERSHVVPEAVHA